MKIAQTLVAAAAIAACTGALAAPILWISDGGSRLGTVDVATGVSSLVGVMSTSMFDIAFDSLGNLWGISGAAQLYSINSSTAVATLVGSTGTGFINSLVFGPGGVLYAAGSSLYSLDTTTGAGTLIGAAGNGYNSSGDLAFVGGTLYLSSDPSANDSLWSIDTTTGQGTNIGAIGANAVFGLATPDNVTLYGLSGTTVLSINTTTGSGSLVVANYSGGGMTGAFGTAFRTEAGAPIPEPSALSLVALALLGLGWASKRQKS